MNKMLVAKLGSWRNGNGMAPISINEDEAKEILRAYSSHLSEHIILKEEISNEMQLLGLLAIRSLLGEYRVWV